MTNICYKEGYQSDLNLMMQHAKTAVRLKAHKIYLLKKQIHLTMMECGTIFFWVLVGVNFNLHCNLTLTFKFKF